MPRVCELWFLAATVTVALIVSGIHPVDRTTWWLEIAPVLIALPLLALTYRRFPFTRIVYWLIAGHAIILIIGGHYTYAQVPAGNWVRDWLGLKRNNYDRLGHLAQGFVPAMIVREILVKLSPLKPGRWLFFLTACVCLAFSATFEFFEWFVAIVSGGATAYLATQGDVWDTQWDMLCALIGTIIAQLILARMHDRQIRSMGETQRNP